MKKQSAFQLLLVLSVGVLCGCRGLQSELQKSRSQKAPSAAEVSGGKVHLSSSLKRSSHAADKGFDLKGEVVLSSETGAVPPGVGVHHLALRPSQPGFYVMNFREENGIWKSVIQRDDRFSGTTKVENGRIVIRFEWKDQGKGLFQKADQFAAYDVSVTVMDAQKEQHVLTTPNVPTD